MCERKPKYLIIMGKFIKHKLKYILVAFLILLFSISFLGCNNNEDYALKIEKKDALKYVYNTYTQRVSQRFVANSEFDDLGLTGDYEGNAVEFSETQLAYSNNNYKLKLKINQKKYEEIKSNYDYSKLYIWICVVYTGNQKVTLTNYNDAFIGSTKTFSKKEQNVWHKVKIHLTMQVKEKLFDENGNSKELNLFSSYFNTTENDQIIKIYVGDIGFCN